MEDALIYGLIQAHKLVLIFLLDLREVLLRSGKASAYQEKEHHSYRFIQLDSRQHHI
jgi:hypothetical protein